MEQIQKISNSDRIVTFELDGHKLLALRFRRFATDGRAAGTRCVGLFMRNGMFQPLTFQCNLFWNTI
jgi:hypothetical protein